MAMTEKSRSDQILRSYILRMRHKKKQEMETSISLERRKREEEINRNRVKMTLEEIGSEVKKLETKLSELKQQKHQLFSQLKKVLNEDDIRRRNRDIQWNANSALFAAAVAASAAEAQPPIGHNAGLFAPQLSANHYNPLYFGANTPSLRPTNVFSRFPSVRKRTADQSMVNTGYKGGVTAYSAQRGAEFGGPYSGVPYSVMTSSLNPLTNRNTNYNKNF